MPPKLQLSRKTLFKKDDIIPPATHNLLIGIWSHISRHRRIQVSLLLLVMFASGAAELVSLGSILPFLAVVSDPARLWQQPLVQDLSSRIGYTQPNELVFPVTIVFSIAVVLAALVRLANIWLNCRMAAAVGSDLSCEAYCRTLYQPYEIHLQRNSAEVITSITAHVGRTTVALNSFLQMLTAAVVAISLLVGLFLIDWKVALQTATLFGSVYFFLAMSARRELLLNSNRVAAMAKQQLQALQEGLGAIRDLVLDGNQRTYVENYRRVDRPQRFLLAKNQFISAFPRYAIEALGLVAIALLGGLLITRQGPSVAVIPLLGALALGAQRLCQLCSRYIPLDHHKEF